MVGIGIRGDSRCAGGRSNALGRWGHLALPLAGLLALLVSACGTPADAGGQLAASQRFVYPFIGPSAVDDPSNPEVLDPAEIAAAEDSTSSSMIYSGLVTLDAGLNVVNDSVSKIDVDPTGTKYTFHLLPDLRFSDGQPIQAIDFAYSIDRALDPHICDALDANGNVTSAYGNSPYGPNCSYVGSTYLNHILGAGARINGGGGSDHSVVASQGDDPSKGVSVLDAQTLVIRLDAPVGFFLEALTYPTSYPIEKALVDKYPKGQWVYHLNEGGCSGPFKIKSYTDKKEIVYVPNPYWPVDGRDGKTTQQLKLNLTEVDRPFVASLDAAYSTYRAGQDDFTEVPGKDYAYARGQDDFHEVGALQIDYFGFNRLTPPFDNLYVRQAFSLALNKQLLVDRIYNGGAIPTNHIVPQGMPGYNPSLLTPPPDKSQSLTGNQSAAQGLLKQAAGSCTGSQTDPDYCPFIDATHYSPLKEIDVYTNRSNQTRVDLATAATEEWNAVLSVNIQERTVTIDDIIANTQPSRGANGYGAWAIGWLADYPDPQDFLSLQFQSNSQNNTTHVNDPDLDQLFNKADTLSDPSKVQQRLAYYNQAEQKLVDTVSWLPYLQKKATWRQRFWVHGFGLNPVYIFPDIGWPNVYITAH